MNRREILGRLLQIPPAIVGIVAVGFLLVHLAPGDPVLALAGDSGDVEYYAFMRDKFGLDEPLGTQFAVFARNLLTGDLGTSYVHGREVMVVIGERLGATALLAGTALVLSTIGGVFLGVVGASRPGGTRDVAVTGFTLGMYAAPVFWIGQIALVVFSLRLGWFPVNGMTSAVVPETLGARAIDLAHHLALPALVLASQQVASIARLTRAGVVEELESPHVRTARAKGLPRRVVLLRHALRRALLPVVTVIGARVGYLLAGATVVEIVFGWPGIGRLMLTAVQNRDIPILLGVFLIAAGTAVVANLLTDLTYGKLDPRLHRA
ncbi:MAG: ABC transporter permease [Acidimicrobiia bacterium]